MNGSRRREGKVTEMVAVAVVGGIKNERGREKQIKVEDNVGLCLDVG